MMKKLFLILLLVCTSAFAETEFKIFTLQHRFANDLLPMIDPMVGADGTANGIDNQLIVRAQPQRMRDIEALVAKLDAARTNRKITVSTSNNVRSQREGVEVSGNVKKSRVLIGNNTRMPNSTRPDNTRIDIENSTRNTRQNSNQFINVLDGERAFIKVGQLVPFTQEWVTITRRYIQVDRFTDWREVTTGFAVRPRTIGNEVELEITPRIARLNGQGFIDFEELTTVIRTNLGSWVDIGGTMQNNDEVSRKILGFQNSSSQQNSSLSVKVD
jgi:type II secretory pathway component GspD/PulD (secretin)